MLKMNKAPFIGLYDPYTSIWRCLFVIFISIILSIPTMINLYQPLLFRDAFYPFAWAFGAGCLTTNMRANRGLAAFHMILSLFALGWGVFFTFILFNFMGQNDINWQGEYAFNNLSPSNVSINITAEHPNDGAFMTVVISSILCTSFCFFEFIYSLAYVILRGDWNRLQMTDKKPKDPYISRDVHASSDLGMSGMISGMAVFYVALTAFIFNLVYYCRNVNSFVGEYGNGFVLVFVCIPCMAFPVPVNADNTAIIVGDNVDREDNNTHPNSLERELREIPMSLKENKDFIPLTIMYIITFFIGFAMAVYSFMFTRYWTVQMYDMVEFYTLDFKNAEGINIYTDCPNCINEWLTSNDVFDIFIIVFGFIALSCLCSYYIKAIRYV